MARLSPPDYSYLQVDRPVVEGGKHFLALAREIGGTVLGVEYNASISLYGMEADEDSEDSQPEVMHLEKPVGNPIFETCNPNELAMVLLHRRVPMDEAHRYRLGSTKDRLDREFVVPRSKVKGHGGHSQKRGARVSGLKTDLARISSDHDIDPEFTPVLCDRIDVLGEPGSSTVLGLFPAPAQIAARALHEQAKATALRLDRENPPLARPTGPWQVAIPFSRFGDGVGDHQYMHVIATLNEHMPVRMTLGNPRVTAH